MHEALVGPPTKFLAYLEFCLHEILVEPLVKMRDHWNDILPHLCLEIANVLERLCQNRVSGDPRKLPTAQFNLLGTKDAIAKNSMPWIRKSVMDLTQMKLASLLGKL